MKARPTPRHQLYVKIGKPAVKRWIDPAADPDPKRWALAEDVMPKEQNPRAEQKPEAKKIEPAAQSEPAKAADGIPEIPEVPEEKPEAKKPGRPKKSAAKKATKTKGAE